MDYERGGKQKDFYNETEVKTAVCPYCGENNCREIYKERGALGIVRCINCNLIYVNPQLKEPEKVYWGDEEKYFKEARMIFEGKAKHHRDPNYISDLKLIYRYKPSGRLLDVGTNMGFFLRNAKGWGWEIYGVEPSPALSDMARKYFELNIKTAFLKNAVFDDNYFDVITMTDVFEHITDPLKLLKEVHRILKPDGIVFIKVPNGNFNILKFNIAKLSGKLRDYDIFDSYEHVVHYTENTLGKMLKKSFFKPINYFIGKPIQIPVWHKYVGHYYQYPSPWGLDWKRQTTRNALYYLSLFEYKLRFNHIGYLAPNVIAIAKKAG